MGKLHVCILYFYFICLGDYIVVPSALYIIASSSYFSCLNHGVIGGQLFNLFGFNSPWLDVLR